MSVFETPLQIPALRTLLEEFYRSALEIAHTGDTYTLALPQTFPDGWQMTIDLQDHLPAGVRLSDRGKTLGWLLGHGQNIETEAMAAHIREICVEAEMERDGLELFCWIPKSIEGAQIHIFAEALVAVAHLHYLRDAKPRTLDIPDRTLKRVFADHHIAAVANATLHGRVRKDVRVDYLIEKQEMAFQIIRRHGRILSTMEQWGWRWHDLKSALPKLQPVMLYDPHNQEIDSESRAIGEEVCGLFCSYEETDRIHSFITQRRH